MCCHNQWDRQESWGKVKHFFPQRSDVRDVTESTWGQYRKLNTTKSTVSSRQMRSLIVHTWNNSDLTRHKYSQFDPKNVHLRFQYMLICFSWVMYDAPRLETLSKCLAKNRFELLGELNNTDAVFFEFAASL